ncbi:hypothetical protein FOZ60_012470 [Perkinsus olseni]|uniref:Integrase catalytic domain-containing protein n=1 Tax=Perkinsus olseni TaxID=32597 RepID=A0A7J6NBE4_PEROL|nr:hypothetical protein FOZ60_012470 [Perkinsus olseni]
MVEQTATWWVQRQLDQEAPWGDTISFTQEEVEEVLLIQQAEPTISVAKAIVKPKLHEMDDGTYQNIMGKHRRLLQRLRRWRSRVCDINYKDPTEDEVWRSLCQWKQSLCEYINLIKTVITNGEVNNVATRTRRKWKLQYMVKNDLLYRKVRHDQHGRTYLQMVIPESDSLVVALIRRYHVQRAHNGVGDTLQSLLQEVWWKGIKRHVQQYVRGCYICQLVRGQTHTSEPGTMYATPEPWYLVGVDLTGPYTESSDGYRYLLTCTCLYTRYMVVQPIKNMTVDSVLVALKKVCSIYGNPHMMVSDNGVQFISKKFQSYCNENNIHHRLIPRYSPNLGGGYERPHQLLHRGLISLLLEGERTLTPTTKEWVDYLDDILWVINTRTLHYKKTGSISPFELMMARKPRMGELPKRVSRDQWQTVTKIPSTTVIDKQRQKVREQLQQRFIPVWESMREKSRETVISKASKYPKRELREGDYAWIFKKKSHKLDLPWKGPYEVLRVDGVKVSLKLDDQHTIVDSFDHVLKVEKPWTLTKTTKGGLTPGTVIIFGDAEIGIVESSRGNDTLLHMVRATPHYSTAYYLQKLYWNPKTGSIVGESIKDSNFGGYKISAGCDNGDASGKEEWLPLLRAHSFKKGGGQRSLQCDYQVLM